MANRLICVLLLLTGGVQAQVYLSRTVQTAILKPVPAVSYLLDNLSTAPASAYSLRKLRAGYTGSAIRVRRSSDNTEGDIGFTSGGLLDQTALLAFTGSGSGFVTVWYDQVGTANFTNTNTGNQPRIVNAGVVERINSLPGVRALGSGTPLTSTRSISVSTLHVVSVATLTNSAGNYGRLLSIGNDGQVDYNNTSFAAIDRNGTNAQMQVERGSGFGSTAISYDAAFTYSVKWDGTNVTLTLNGTQVGSTGSTGNFGSGIVRLFTDTSSQFSWDGYAQEVLIFTPSVSSNADQTAIQSSQKTFYGTP